jgi:hypothetical protein
MNLISCVGLISLCGAIGGGAACLHREKVLFPRFDREANVWIPGGVGTILIGAIAATLVWALYGPLSTYDLVNPSPVPLTLTLQQLGLSGITGFTGGRTLTLLAQKQIDRNARDTGAKISKKFIEGTLKKD